MGACFNTASFPACDETTLKTKFKYLQADMCNDNGSDAYAGHIGIAKGLKILSLSFKNKLEAHDYLDNHCEKWGSAVAVKVGDFSKVFPVTATEKKEVEKLNDLQNRFSNWENDLIGRTKKAKSTQRGCKKCGSKIATKYLSTINCPICGDIHFIQTPTDSKNYLTLRTNLKAQQDKIKTLSKKYEEKNKDNFWLVGALCAS